MSAQIASIDNRFNIFGQGSWPKLLFATVTAHLCFPMHFFSKTAYEVGAWQDPCLKLPQVPRAVPKLANLMAEICWLEAQCKWTLGAWNSSVILKLSMSQFLAFRWFSATCAHTLVTVLFRREILVGSPPVSSKTTIRFLLGFNQDRGTWYLQNQNFRCLLHNHVIQHQHQYQHYLKDSKEAPPNAGRGG